MKWVLLALFAIISLSLLFAFPDLISDSTRLLVTYIGCCIMLAAEYVEAAIERMMDR